MQPRLWVIRLALCLFVGSGALTAGAAEFRSVGTAPAVLYDAPSAKGNKVFVAPRGMPVEIVLAYGDWTKVRDAGGDLSWVESKQLSSRRMLVVSAPQARVRASADDGAALVMTAEHGVLLELAEPVASGWLRVRHHDGLAGFVKAGEVWGD
jgi:SH3-like domain-containing protein